MAGVVVWLVLLGSSQLARPRAHPSAAALLMKPQALTRLFLLPQSFFGSNQIALCEKPGYDPCDAFFGSNTSER
jgi:hypothetical protein